MLRPQAFLSHNTQRKFEVKHGHIVRELRNLFRLTELFWLMTRPSRGCFGELQVSAEVIQGHFVLGITVQGRHMYTCTLTRESQCLECMIKNYVCKKYQKFFEALD